MSILMIGATHGNELLGPKLYQRLLQKRSPLLEHIDFIIGNPRAYVQRIRYTEHDLNRSYGVDGDSYEHERAREIEQHIERTQPDIIIDMHTTTSVQPNCLIVADMTGSMKRRFLRASHIETILQVQPMHDIVTLGDNVIGYEVPNHATTPRLLDSIIGDLERFVASDALHRHKKLFTMQDKIYKKDTPPEVTATFINFQPHERGFVPIMTGENSYKRQTDYLGFKSGIPEDIEV